MEGVVEGSRLADVRYLSQVADLRHDINRLTLQYFGGSYEVDEQRQTIRFTYKITN